MDCMVRCCLNTDLKSSLCFKNLEGSQVKGALQIEYTVKLQIQNLHVLLHMDFSQPNKKQVPCPTYLFLKLMFSGLNTSWYAALLPRMRSNRWTASTTALQGNTERRVSEQQVLWDYFMRSGMPAQNHTTLVNSIISKPHYTTTPY